MDGLACMTKAYIHPEALHLSPERPEGAAYSIPMAKPWDNSKEGVSAL